MHLNGYKGGIHLSSIYETLLYEVKDRVGIITINRPKQLNALNSQVYRDLYCILKQIERDDQVSAVIITGRGEKAFIAGADITEMKNMTANEARSFAILGKKVGIAIKEMPQPVIAAVNGFALGGGLELALSCDLILAVEKAKFGLPEINLGIIPGNGGTQRVTRLTNIIIAKELILFGGRINAQRACELGLINKVVTSEEGLLAEAMEWAGKLVQKSVIALSLAKSAINNGIDASLETALSYELQCFAQCFASRDQEEGMTAFLERRIPVFKGQ